MVSLLIVIVTVTVSGQDTGVAGSVRDRFVGAWRLVHIDAPGPDGKPNDIPQPTGMLIYTRDGHMSVQLMYPKAVNALSDEYVQNGYQASFGMYGPPPCRKREIRVTTIWSAPMYTAFIGARSSWP